MWPHLWFGFKEKVGPNGPKNDPPKSPRLAFGKAIKSWKKSKIKTGRFSHKMVFKSYDASASNTFSFLPSIIELRLAKKF